MIASALCYVVYWNELAAAARARDGTAAPNTEHIWNTSFWNTSLLLLLLYWVLGQ